MATDNLNFQKLSTVQNKTMPPPSTIVAAATVAPTSFLTFLTGTTQVVTITPPVDGQHMIALCFTDNSPGAFTTAGNIQIAYQPIVNRPILLIYDPLTAKYWAAAVV
jgi:hypothetical protein